MSDDELLERLRKKALESHIDLARVEMSKFFSVLRHSIWHTTSPSGLLGILSSGLIRPNRRDLPYSFPQTANSYGFFKGYVCLFDFEVVEEDKCIDIWGLWSVFFFSHKPFTVAIELDRASLGDRLIPNAAAEHEVGIKKVWIPHVEAWHKGSVDLKSTASRCLLIPAHGIGGQPTSVALDDPRLIPAMELLTHVVHPKPPDVPMAEFLNRLQEWEKPLGSDDGPKAR
jgi:hypothetical protein